MDCSLQEAILKMLIADRTRFVGNVSDSTVISRDCFNTGILDDYPDMRLLVTNSMLVNLKKARYEYCKDKSDCDSLVFDNLAFRDLIDELKGILNGKPLSIETFEDYLINKDFKSKDIDFVENYLKSKSGFSLDSRSISYQECDNEN